MPYELVGVFEEYRVSLVEISSFEINVLVKEKLFLMEKYGFSTNM